MEAVDVKVEEQTSHDLQDLEVKSNVNSSSAIDAVYCNDWVQLRKMSLRPGGFGEDRRKVWCVEATPNDHRRY